MGSKAESTRRGEYLEELRGLFKNDFDEDEDSDDLSELSASADWSLEQAAEVNIGFRAFFHFVQSCYYLAVFDHRIVLQEIEKGFPNPQEAQPTLDRLKRYIAKVRRQLEKEAGLLLDLCTDYEKTALNRGTQLMDTEAKVRRQRLKETHSSTPNPVRGK